MPLLDFTYLSEYETEYGSAIYQGDESLEDWPLPASCLSLHSCVHAHQNLPPPEVLAQEIVEQLK